MSTSIYPVIPWNGSSTQESWQELLDYFGYVVVELHLPVKIPFYFKREGWGDSTLVIASKSSYEEMLAKRRFSRIQGPYPIDSGNFYRLVAE